MKLDAGNHRRIAAKHRRELQTERRLERITDLLHLRLSKAVPP